MSKYRDPFLYLAIACFLGIVAIFVFAGYLGVYDTVRVSTSEHEQSFGPEVWLGELPYRPYPFLGAVWGEPIRFHYEIDNRRSSAYSATVQVSLWKSNQKVLDLLRQDVAIAGFGKANLEWTLSPADIERAGLQVGQYTVKISRGGIDLGQGLDFRTAYPLEPPKPVPVPQ